MFTHKSYEINGLKHFHRLNEGEVCKNVTGKQFFFYISQSHFLTNLGIAFANFRSLSSPSRFVSCMRD